MSYLQDKKRKNKKYLNFLIAGALLVLFVFFSANIFGFLSKPALFVLRPLVSMGQRMSENIKNIGLVFTSKRTLLNENADLREKLRAQEARLANHEALFNENEKIKEILFRKPSQAEMLIAGILGNPNKSPYDTLLIDAGLEDGVVLGASVFAYGDIPIGKIIEVSNKTAKVNLYSTYGEKVSGVLSGSDTFVELIGRGRGNFELILPRDFELANGTLVLLPGIHPYALAEVTAVVSDPRDPFKKALLRSPINLFELKFVQVEI